MTTIGAALLIAARRLAHSESARLDAEVLLAHTLGQTRTYLRTWPERALTDAQARAFDDLVERRIQGHPVAHLTGAREFWSLSLRVSSDTLIPRPDTERLVELALERLPEHVALKMADLGTGSGAIALAVGSERPLCHITATDLSTAALTIARDNAQRLGLDNLAFVAGDWCAALGHAQFDMIVANPPYIARDDPHLQMGDVRFEPMRALSAGDDGLDDLRHIICCAPDHLRAGGWLLLEHGFDQGPAVSALMRGHGYSAVADFADAGGHARVCIGRRSA